jgi:hypothetical protein
MYSHIIYIYIYVDTCHHIIMVNVSPYATQYYMQHIIIYTLINTATVPIITTTCISTRLGHWTAPSLSNTHTHVRTLYISVTPHTCISLQWGSCALPHCSTSARLLSYASSLCNTHIHVHTLYISVTTTYYSEDHVPYHTVVPTVRCCVIVAGNITDNNALNEPVPQ